MIFPAFSTIQDDREKFNSNYIRSFNLLALVMFLGSLVLVISSRPFIAIALTEKWLPAVPYMQIFFLDGFFFPLMMFNQNILYSAGLGGLSLKIDLARKAVILLSIIILFRFGIKALIAGQVFSTLVALISSALAAAGRQGLSFQRMLIPQLKLLLIAGLCFLASRLFIERVSGTDWVELVLKITVIPALFLGLTKLSGHNALKELNYFLKDIRFRT